MRINKYIALASGISRRQADEFISSGKVSVNKLPATLGQNVDLSDTVTLSGKILSLPSEHTTIALNKPKGYVTSRDGQGGQTIYDLLPQKYHSLKPIGRLDKDSSGVLLLTNDGDLAQKLSHPSNQKEKVYKVVLDKNLDPAHFERIEEGVELEDGTSKLALSGQDKSWQVTMSEGRNRQIRRTFAALGYKVIDLQRIKFGDTSLGKLPEAKYEIL